MKKDDKLAHGAAARQWIDIAIEVALTVLTIIRRRRRKRRR